MIPGANQKERNMKHVIKLILFTSFLATAAHCAQSAEEAYVESYTGRADMPVPISVVRPVIAPGYEGEVVKLSFFVDEKGLPREISAPADTARALADQLTRAVAQWRFKPLTRDGAAVRTRVVLPIVIGDTSGDGFVAQR